MADGGIKGAVEHGVETAYAVYEEYMRRGREAAYRRQDNINSGGDMNYGRQCGYDWPNPWGPMASLVTPWFQMSRAWMDMAAAFMPGFAGSCGPWSAPYGTHGYAGASPRSCIPVEISSRHFAEVLLELAPGVECGPLQVSALTRWGSQGGSNVVAEFVSIEGRTRLRVTVPDAAPEGCYRGNVFDHCGVRRGEVIVEIREYPKGEPRGGD